MTRHYSIEGSQIEALCGTADGLRQWLLENGTACEISQKHLDSGTVEQAYWHYGYLCAIRDILSLIESDSTE